MLRAAGRSRKRLLRQSVQGQRGGRETAPPGGEEIQRPRRHVRERDPRRHDPRGGAAEEDDVLQPPQRHQVRPCN